ncbi:GNAT family N-acetyltransferase [Anaerocolumna sp.]|uniref:GNAT family N-acetyltransferase n=1 Tax=Anaerocolumna sp. TaxID=2041569 RepID=UPI0028B0202D|nr:GNAT family N-acetyltransferase [Anaerocolumna sp.]
MNLYTVEELEFGSKRYEQTLLLRDKIMRKPLGLSIKNDDLSYEQQAAVFAVFDGETILGTGVLIFEGEATAKVRFLCVEPNLQKSGIGRAILESMEKRSLQHGIKKICLESRVTAKDFYKKLGYQEYGEIYLMNQAPVEHIRMQKIL